MTKQLLLSLPMYVFEAIILYGLAQITLGNKVSITIIFYVFIFCALKLVKYLLIHEMDYVIYLYSVVSDFLLVCCFFRGKVYLKLFAVLLFYAGMLASDAATFIILVCKGNLDFSSMNVQDISGTSLIISRFLLLLLTLLYYKLHKKLKYVLEKPLLAIPLPLIVCILQFFLSPIGPLYYEAPVTVYIIFSVTLIFSLALFYTTALYREKKKHMEIHCRYEQELLGLQEKYYIGLYEQYQKVSTVRHEAAELLHYVKDIHDPVYISNLESVLDRSFAYTGIRELDAVLYFLINDAKSKAVSVDIITQISGELSWIEPVHFFILAHNAIQNAVEGVLDIPADMQEDVIFKLSGSEYRLSLQVRNPTILTYKRAAGVPIKRSKKAPGRGVGMTNMLRIVKLYDGYMEYEAKDGYFNIQMMLQNTGKGSEDTLGRTGK